MKNPQLFYILGLILVLLGFLDLAFMTYSNHAMNGVMVSVWGLACLIWGVRTELVRK